MDYMIQVAGIKSYNEAEMLYSCGVTHLGFPLRLPVHKEDISEDECAEIVMRIAKLVETQKGQGRYSEPVVITYASSADEAMELCRKLSIDTVQLHGDITIHELSKLRANLPQVKIIKSIVIDDENVSKYTEFVRQYEGFVDLFITDTFDHHSGASGATGKTHNWDISRHIVNVSSKPIIAAGGLNDLNVEAAIQHIRPFGVDAHTGLEDEQGNKMKGKVMDFVNRAKRRLSVIP